MQGYQIIIAAAAFTFAEVIFANRVIRGGAFNQRELKNRVKDQMIHVVILSDRLTATAVTLGSVCRASKSKFYFHVFSSNDNEFQGHFGRLQDCSGSMLELHSIDQATESLLELGFKPIWRQGARKKYGMNTGAGKEKKWGIQTPYRSEKHADALNLLRFYLPHLPSLSALDKFIFLDDDVILQRDIHELLNLEIKPEAAMLAGCQHWLWNGNAPGNFETSWNMTVFETGYIGNLKEVCNTTKEQPYGCVRAGLQDNLSLVSQLLDPQSKFANRPLERQAFNMGLNVFDTKAWKTLKLSHRFEKWVDASNNLRLFPLDTLAFGLGLGYLALGDTVQCYEPGPISHLVGLGFVGEESLAAAGWPLQKIHDEAYALHYNGAHKPWEDVEVGSLCSDEPKSLFDMYKRVCEDVGICTCVNPVQNHRNRKLFKEQGESHSNDLHKSTYDIFDYLVVGLLLGFEMALVAFFVYLGQPSVLSDARVFSRMTNRPCEHVKRWRSFAAAVKVNLSKHRDSEQKMS